MASRFRWTLTNLSDSSTVVLDRDPIGWEDMTLKLSRHEEYHGVFIDYSVSLKWHCRGGGKEFIDNVYNTEDVNGNIEVLIEIDCDGSETYSELYRGKLDLSKYQTDGEYTECTIEKNDLFSKLRARDEISVNLETTESIGGETILAPSLPTINLHSQKILLQAAMEGQPFEALNPHSSVADSILFRGFINHGLTITNAEAEQFVGWNDFDDMALNGPTAASSIMPEIFTANDTIIEYPAVYSYAVEMSGTFYDKVTGTPNRQNTAHNLILAYGQTLNTATTISLFSSGGYTTAATNYSEPFDTTALTGTIPLNYGDKIWLYWFESETIITGPYLDKLDYEYHYDVAEFSLEIDSTTAETECKVALVHEAFQQVVDAIADTDYKFYSEFYGRTDSEKLSYAQNGCGSLVSITNGLNIREFEDKQIFCSLRDLFHSLNAIHNIGLTIEQYSSVYVGDIDIIRVEPLSYFYDTATEVIALTRPVKVRRNIANKLYYNSAIIGYSRWETEFKGGLDEPCTQHEYSTKVLGVNGRLTKLSKYMASGYGIEITRRKNSAEERTEDWRYDNENFFIAVKDYYRGEMRFFATGNAVVISLPLGMIQDGDTLVITGTASNDGTYTVDHTETHPLGIAVYLVEAVVNETVTTATLEDVTNPIFQTELYADAFTGGSGMIQYATAYNLRLTPARMLLAHVGSITACLQKVQGDIKFVRGDGNTELQVTKTDVGCQEDFSGDPLTENQSIAWNEVDAANIAPLWIPETISFSYPLTLTEINTIRANPHGYITVTDDHGATHGGFILDISYKLKTGETSFVLLKKA